jgi:hypothetical protein
MRHFTLPHNDGCIVERTSVHARKQEVIENTFVFRNLVRLTVWDNMMNVDSFSYMVLHSSYRDGAINMDLGDSVVSFCFIVKLARDWEP